MTAVWVLQCVVKAGTKQMGIKSGACGDLCKESAWAMGQQGPRASGQMGPAVMSAGKLHGLGDSRGIGPSSAFCNGSAGDVVQQ